MAAKTRNRREDAPKNVWRTWAPPVRLGDERLRFRAIRGSDTLDLGELCTSVRWDDVSMELTGSISLTVDPAKVKLGEGVKVRAEWSPSEGAAFRRLFTLTMGSPTRALEADTFDAELESTLSSVRQGRMDFSFRRDKRHPKGWTCDQIAREVAREAGIPLGKIARGKHRIRNLTRRNADPIDVLILAYRQEREATGRRFFMTWDGRMNIMPLQRSRYMLDVLPALLSGSFTTQRKEAFATVLNVRATARKGKRSNRKIRVRVSDRDGVRLHGVVSKTVKPKGIDTEAEARQWARRSLARRLTPVRQMELTLPLMPNLRRGHALRVRYPVEGLDQVVFVRSASHEWTPTGGTTTVVVRFDDPFASQQDRKNAKRKAEAAKKRDRPTPRSARGAERVERPRPKSERKRGDK